MTFDHQALTLRFQIHEFLFFCFSQVCVSREIFIFDVKSSVKLTKAKRDFSRHMMPSSLLRSRPIKKMLQISGGLKNKRSIAPMIDIFACQKI